MGIRASEIRLKTTTMTSAMLPVLYNKVPMLAGNGCLFVIRPEPENWVIMAEDR